MEYAVTFKIYHTYWVEAEDEDDALNKAHKNFLSDMHMSVANTYYDDVEIECDDEEDVDYDEDEEERSCETCYGHDMEHDEVDNPCWNCKGNYSEWSPKK